MYYLFDCDGTLFDTEALKAESWGRGIIEILTSNGENLGEEKSNEIISKVTKMYKAGGKTEEVASHILYECKKTFAKENLFKIIELIPPKTLIQKRKEAKDKIFNMAFPIDSPAKTNKKLLIEQSWDFIKQLKARNIEIGLVTTTKELWVKRYFKAYHLELGNLYKFFKIMICGKKKSKGVKEAVCKFSNKIADNEIVDDEIIDKLFLECNPKDFILVEDSLEGTLEGKKVGVNVITIPNNFTKVSFPDLLLTPIGKKNMKWDNIIDYFEAIN